MYIFSECHNCALRFTSPIFWRKLRYLVFSIQHLYGSIGVFTGDTGHKQRWVDFGQNPVLPSGIRKNEVIESRYVSFTELAKTNQAN